jgi:hypothetical protein
VSKEGNLKKYQESGRLAWRLGPKLAHANSISFLFDRWDDDVIFKNQARGVDDQPKKRFINDMLRSDFHKKFLHKYIH